VKISTSKLIANRANAAKSTGPRSIEGKRISSENAQRHGLASSLVASLDLRAPAIAALVGEATGLGFSASEAEELVTRLAAARDVIDAKHACFKEKPEAERLPNMSPEALYRTIKEMETPRSGVTSAERRAVFTLLYRQIKEHNDRARRFAKKLEGHRKLMRYEQRAVNQIRKAVRIKK
jgi:enoyl-CoA hydratase/carnithine racemase